MLWIKFFFQEDQLKTSLEYFLSSKSAKIYAGVITKPHDIQGVIQNESQYTIDCN